MLASCGVLGGVPGGCCTLYSVYTLKWIGHDCPKVSLEALGSMDAAPDPGPPTMTATPTGLPFQPLYSLRTL